ncbi:MAG: YbjN domain-containing protein [Alphaproteobacteria bacterium]|nr:YbjN domain-containing protein [Rhodospirillales bacterium]MCW9046093.1 YbjN domain-containing protein [Alphaproteobacteria bacterium]
MSGIQLADDFISPTDNPLEVIEEIVLGKEWSCDRRSPDELAIEIVGKWCDFSLFFAWSQNAGALHFSCSFDMRVPENKKDEVFRLLIQINEKMWLGYFSFWEEEGLPLFRHTMLLKGQISADQLEDLLEIAVSECNRFYPAFQFVIWGGKTASEAVEAAMIETVGEA